MAVYSQGASPVLPIGNNALVGNFSASFASGAAAGTSVTISVPLPTNPQPNALYGIGIVNPSSLGTAITVTLQNLCQMADGNNYYMNVLTNYQVNSGQNAFIVVQGFLLGDGASQITVTVTSATTGAGTVLIQVREV